MNTSSSISSLRGGCNGRSFRAAVLPRGPLLPAQALRQRLQRLALHHLVEDALAGPAADAPAPRRWLKQGAAPALRATLVLLLLPEPLLGTLPLELRTSFIALRATASMPPALRAEVERLREQLAALEQRCCVP